jgi:hypothetical protein
MSIAYRFYGIMVLSGIYLLHSSCNPTPYAAVTYELSPGRFGDNLLAYIHAKWISYTYQIPLLYRPFIYSSHLRLHELESPYTQADVDHFPTVVTLGPTSTISADQSCLYIVPYFPESSWELQHGTSFHGGPWYSFRVDWNDQQFIQELQTMIAPRQPIPLLELPSDRITVAMHIRAGGNHDTPETLLQFPLKFVPLSYYIYNLRQLYDFLDQHPLYVYIFTDDNNPMDMVHAIQEQIPGLDIYLDCRTSGNSDTTNVLEDFFALLQFDCLIHSQSNFSFIMGKIGGYMVSLFPESFSLQQNERLYVTHVTVYNAHPQCMKLSLKNDATFFQDHPVTIPAGKNRLKR